MMIGVAPRALAARRETRPIGPAPLQREQGDERSSVSTVCHITCLAL